MEHMSTFRALINQTTLEKRRGRKEKKIREHAL